MKKMTFAIIMAALILFGVSFSLNGIAARNAQREHIWLMQTILPGSENFTVEPYAGEDANIRSVHKGENGFVIETVTDGYADEIIMLIGVDNDGYVTGLVVKESHETFGLGNQILTDHVFLSQFLNGTGEFAVATSGTDTFSGATGTTDSESATDIDAVTGATVTSKAVVRCVNSAVAYVTGVDASSSATTWEG